MRFALVLLIILGALSAMSAASAGTAVRRCETVPAGHYTGGINAQITFCARPAHPPNHGVVHGWSSYRNDDSHAHTWLLAVKANRWNHRSVNIRPIPIALDGTGWSKAINGAAYKKFRLRPGQVVKLGFSYKAKYRNICFALVVYSTNFANFSAPLLPFCPKGVGG